MVWDTDSPMKRDRYSKSHFKRIPYTRRTFIGRPPWWPEDEPWPPIHRLIKRKKHLSLLPRLMVGLFFAFLVCSLGLSFIAHLITKLLDGVAWPDATLPGVLIGVVGVVAIIFFFAGRALLRLVSPIDQMVSASDRIARGEYFVRIAERGSPEMRSLARAFNAMAKQLEEHEKQRRNLMANVTHELRTPLTVIQGRIEGMLDGVYPRQDAHFESILDETRQMGRLIEDLRTLALAESGALDLRKEPTDVSVLIGETIAALRPHAEEKGVDCYVECEDEISLANIDPLRIRTVLVNLIMNAVRHSSSDDKIRATCKMLEQDHLEIAVHDTGEGIAAQDLPHIFKRFYKSKDSTGSGLGLAIVKELVEAHQGKIEVESKIGEGTSVRVRLPIDAD
jgi:signal transduction histidine kinase